MATELAAADEVFHAAGDDADWCESGWFGFHIPDRNINGFVYYFHDVRTGVSGGGPALWDPSGEGYGEDQEFFAREKVRALT